MSAKESSLEKLHELMADRFLKILETQGDELSPQMVSQILKFLKDSNITADEDNNPELKELKDSMLDEMDYPFDIDNSTHPLQLIK